MGRVRRRHSLSTDLTPSRAWVMSSRAGAKRAEVMRFGERALMGVPRARRPGSNAWSERRLTNARPTTICLSHAPRKISLS